MSLSVPLFFVDKFPRMSTPVVAYLFGQESKELTFVDGSKGVVDIVRLQRKWGVELCMSKRSSLTPPSGRFKGNKWVHEGESKVKILKVRNGCILLLWEVGGNKISY